MSVLAALNFYDTAKTQLDKMLQSLAPLIAVEYDGIDGGELHEGDVHIYTHHYCCGDTDHDTTKIPLAFAEEFFAADADKRKLMLDDLKKARQREAEVARAQAAADYAASEEKRQRELYEKLRTKFEGQ